MPCKQPGDETWEKDVSFTPGKASSRRRARLIRKTTIEIKLAAEVDPPLETCLSGPSAEASAEGDPHEGPSVVSLCIEPPEASAETPMYIPEGSLCQAEELKAAGNEALKRREYEEAKKLYSQGLSLLCEQLVSCRQLVSKLYSNRAAASMHQSDFCSALDDCQAARKSNPRNVRAYTRASTCHIALGQFCEATFLSEKALDMLSASDPQFKGVQDQLLLTETLKDYKEEITLRFADGDVKEDLIVHVEELCRHAHHCEQLWRLAACVYLQCSLFDKLDQTIQHVLEILPYQEDEGRDPQCWWKWFHMETLWWNPKATIEQVIEQGDVLLNFMETNALMELDTTPLKQTLTQRTLHQLLENLKLAKSLKDLGNQSIVEKSYKTSVQHYSDAIAACEEVGSPMMFLSILYCNRGAALQGAGRYMEAMADVCIALSLHPLYVKAYLRLCQMHLETNNTVAAREVLASCDAAQLQATPQDSNTLQSLRERVTQSERSELKIDAYKLLGLSVYCNTTEVKKAFKKLALRLHPDKASQSVKLQTSWMQQKPAFVKNLEDEVKSKLHDHMQQLFKLLSSASSVLCDDKQRRELDVDLHRARAVYEGQRFRNASHRNDYYGQTWASYGRAYQSCYSWCG